MNVGDTEKTTKGRYFLNTWLVPRMAQILENGNEVLFIGTDTSWDYKPFFWNPAKQCPYFTLDISEQYKPDIVADIQNCPQVESERFNLVIAIGLYEFLDKKVEAFKEIHRILKPNGYLLIAFPGRGYYPDNRGILPEEIKTMLGELRELERYSIYEGKEEPTSICVLCQKL